MDQKCNACGKSRDLKDMWLAPDGENYCNHISCYQVGVDCEVNYLRRRVRMLLYSVDGLLQTVQNPAFIANKPYLTGYLQSVIANGREDCDSFLQNCTEEEGRT